MWSPGTGRLSRSFYAFAVIACALLAVLHFAGLFGAITAGWSLRGLSAGLVALGGLALGVLSADFATGLAHWACDSYGDKRTPVIGASVIHAFREHHQAPRAMLAHDGIAVNGQPAAAAGALFALLALPGARAVVQDDPFAYAVAWSFLTVGALGNQLHQWSHHPAPPALVRRLQRGGWVLSPHTHARHHRGAHDGVYCVATGWCNGALDALGFWRALEWIVARTTGAQPRDESSVK
jgi:plasmanylethanolamine desaturase